MIFKKPYAFFIKYFRLINFILTALFLLLANNLWNLHNAISKISTGSTSNYSMLGNYVGFKVYFVMFIIAIILIAMIFLLKRKDKPFKDYLFGLLYNGVLLVYLMSVSSLFLSIDETIIEIATLKLYSDISLIVMFPLAYFIVKYFLTVIGFNIKRFNFSKDLMELKQDEKDNEEVEIVFDKNTYKYKRTLRKSLRELKYYFLENRLFITIILGGVILAGIIILFSLNIFKSNDVNMKEAFAMGGFSVSVNKVYETKYDLNNRVIKNDSKFVIADINIRNNGESDSIDFKKIRLLYGENYVYPNDYFNKHFYDIGTPYTNTVLKSGESYNYIFIFKVPVDYKSSKYILKFYDRNVYEEEASAKYISLNFKAKKLDNSAKDTTCSLKEQVTLDKSKYGDSYITINSYEIKNNFVIDNNGLKQVIKSKNANNIVLEIEHEVYLDPKYNISKYFKNSDDFIGSFASLEYTNNGVTKEANNLSIVKDPIGNKTYLSIPYKMNTVDTLILKLNLRDKTLIYKIK